MCITAPAQVVDLDAQGAVVDVDGRRRRASTLVIPDVAVGDWVMVGAGTVLRRLDPEEAAGIARTIRTAAAASDARARPAGGRT
jgi:hydrogenase assembly chaperone HypC/HupF